MEVVCAVLLGDNGVWSQFVVATWANVGQDARGVCVFSCLLSHAGLIALWWTGFHLFDSHSLCCGLMAMNGIGAHCVQVPRHYFDCALPKLQGVCVCLNRILEKGREGQYYYTL